MKKKLVVFYFLLLLTLPTQSFAWGKKGHELVAEIAFNYLDSATKQAVMKYLKNITIEEAATWMDENRSNRFYDYMRTWHYIDIDKGQEYQPSTEKNMLTILNSAFVSLQHKENLKERQIKEYLLIIFHLIGDLHQPLHTGYPSDKGGNSVEIESPIFNGNLHSFWDTQIIELENIKLEECLEFYTTFSTEELKTINKINFLQWMKQSRNLLDGLYNFTDGKIDRAYIDSNKIVIKKQLLIAGLRLANVLKNIFKGNAIQPEKGNVAIVDSSTAKYFNNPTFLDDASNKHLQRFSSFKDFNFGRYNLFYIHKVYVFFPAKSVCDALAVAHSYYNCYKVETV